MAINWAKVKERINALKKEYSQLDNTRVNVSLKRLANGNLDYILQGLNDSAIEYERFINTAFGIALSKSGDQELEQINSPLVNSTGNLLYEISSYGFFYLLIQGIDCYQQKSTFAQLSALRQILLEAIDSFSPDGSVDHDYLRNIESIIREFFKENQSVKKDNCFAKLERKIRWY